MSLTSLFHVPFLRYSDKDVQKDKKLVSYNIVDKATKPYVEVSVGGESKTFSPEEVSAMILVKMKETAEAFLGKTVKHAVVTVPGARDGDRTAVCCS